MSTKFKFLKAWHQINRAHGAEWTYPKELDRANMTNAPFNCVYYEKGMWVIAPDIPDEELRELVYDVAGQIE